MNRNAVIVTLILVVVGLILFFGSQERDRNGYSHRPHEAKSNEKSFNSKEMTPSGSSADKKESIPQDMSLPKAITPTQGINTMDNYEAKLIEKAETLIDRNQTIPSGVVPLVETQGDFTIVYWPIPRDGKNFVPGPSRFAAVYFHKGTLVVEGVLGPH